MFRQAKLRILFQFFNSLIFPKIQPATTCWIQSANLKFSVFTFKIFGDFHSSVSTMANFYTPQKPGNPCPSPTYEFLELSAYLGDNLQHQPVFPMPMSNKSVFVDLPKSYQKPSAD